MKKPPVFAKLPGKLNSRTLAGAIDRLRRIEKLIPRNFSANDLSNAEVYEKRLETGRGFADGLIERQAAFTDMSLGKSTLDYSGCEVIAVYNLLKRYEGGAYSVPLPELIEIFEADGILHAGRFGVSPRSMRDYLRKIGLEVNYTEDEKDFDVLGVFCSHFIVTVMNDRDDIFRQIHTFYISREKDYYVTHNAGMRMRYFSISEIVKALPGGRAKGICLMGVKENETD